MYRVSVGVPEDEGPGTCVSGQLKGRMTSRSARPVRKCTFWAVVDVSKVKSRGFGGTWLASSSDSGDSRDVSCDLECQKMENSELLTINDDELAFVSFKIEIQNRNLEYGGRRCGF